jgi:hypothetical protein
MLVKAFRKKAMDLWVKFMREFPRVDAHTLLDTYENYFLRKKEEGYLGATYYLDYAKELRAKLR